jgi:hypothetical protein
MTSIDDLTHDLKKLVLSKLDDVSAATAATVSKSFRRAADEVATEHKESEPRRYRAKNARVLHDLPSRLKKQMHGAADISVRRRAKLSLRMVRAAIRAFGRRALLVTTRRWLLQQRPTFWKQLVEATKYIRSTIPKSAGPDLHPQLMAALSRRAPASGVDEKHAVYVMSAIVQSVDVWLGSRERA